jgi:hypothetical protein
MRISRWFYVKEPLFPLHDGGPGDQSHHPPMIAELLRMVKENPGLTGGEVAARMGKEGLSTE